MNPRLGQLSSVAARRGGPSWDLKRTKEINCVRCNRATITTRDRDDYLASRNFRQLYRNIPDSAFGDCMTITTRPNTPLLFIFVEHAVSDENLLDSCCQRTFTDTDGSERAERARARRGVYSKTAPVGATSRDVQTVQLLGICSHGGGQPPRQRHTDQSSLYGQHIPEAATKASGQSSKCNYSHTPSSFLAYGTCQSRRVGAALPTANGTTILKSYLDIIKNVITVKLFSIDFR